MNFGLYRFVYLMTGSQPLASTLEEEAQTLINTHGSEVNEMARVAEIVTRVLQLEGRHARNTFRQHDMFTRVPTIRPEPEERRDAAMVLPLLQRRCMVEVLACLPPRQRCVFLLADVFDLSFGEIVEVMEIRNEKSLNVLLTRSRQALEDYLGPRCGHAHAQNACTCEGRVVAAMRSNFLGGEPIGGWSYVSGVVFPLLDLFKRVSQGVK